MKRHKPVFLLGFLCVMASLAWFWSSRTHSTPRAPVVSPEVAAARKERGKGDAAFGTKPEQARIQYSQFVAKHKADANPSVQDEVGAAEIRLGYLAARAGDFETGRKQFLRASKIKGTGAMSADFGGVPDQAAYQAIVCLIAGHKEAEAKKQFRAFIKERPLSPLVTAAFRRLRRLNKNQIDPGDEALVQSAISQQEKHIRFETTVCGPKTVEYLLKTGLIPLGGRTCDGGKAKPDYRQIAKLCGTNRDGVSLDGLRKGLKALGIQSFGVQLNRRDFEKTPVPAIFLQGDHYVALLAVHARKAAVYDSRYGSVTTIPLPPIDDAKFLATVLTFQPPVLSEETN